MKHNKREKTEKRTNIKKMFEYTTKKILWLINYSLSFSKKDNGKEIGIKVLACFVILQAISIFFIIIFSLLEVLILSPVFAIALLSIIGVFVFKKEIKQLFKEERITFKKTHIKHK